MLALSAISSPTWLIGKPQSRIIDNTTVNYRDTLGLYNKCAFRRYRTQYEKKCYIYARSFARITHAAWQASIIFLALALVLLGVAAIFGVISLCKQLIGRKSFVNLAGTLQAFAGIFLIIVIVVYPVGWTNKQVKSLCHEKYDVPKAFSLGYCDIGPAYYCAIGSTLAAFACSLFSFIADKSVFADKVQDEILDGKSMICTL